MRTLLWLIAVLVLWQTGLLSAILYTIGGMIMWAGAVLSPSLGVL